MSETAENLQQYNYIELNNMVTRTGEDGFLMLEKDMEAEREYSRFINDNTMHFNSIMERFNYLIENDYYVNFLETYKESQIIRLHEIAYSYNHQFGSYMQAFKFYNDYALRTNDRKTYLENFAQHNVVVALALGKGSFKRAERKLRAFMEQRVQPATPTYLNAGQARGGELVSCYLLTMDDTTNSIEYNLGAMAQLSRIGGGVACDLSNLRGLGDPIKGLEKAAKGVIGVAKQMEGKFSYYDQGGKRRGSGAAYIHVFHPESRRLMDAKKVNADDKIRLNELSVGLIMPNVFYALAHKDEVFYGFSPYDIQKYYGLKFTDIDFDDYYYVFLKDERIRREAHGKARDFMNRIVTTQMQSGYPYLFNITNANKQHALSRCGRVLMSNLCTEIMQLQEVSVINDYAEEDDIKRDISCNLASLNIANVMASGDIAGSVRTGMDVVTEVSRTSKVPNAPGVMKAAKELHAVGLGAMNLQGYLVSQLISYASKEARDFARTFFMMMNFYSLERSMEIAVEENETFKGFEDSDYADGSYFDKYLKNDYFPQTDKVAELFKGIKVPTIADWKELKEKVMKNGLYNAYRLAIAPTQSISYVQNATSSVMPIVDLVEVRTYANSTTFYPAPFLTKDNQWYYNIAYNMDMKKIIDMVAVIQEHVDQGISTVLFVPQDIGTADVASLYIYAALKGLKSLYYTRVKVEQMDKREDLAGFCVSCAV